MAKLKGRTSQIIMMLEKDGKVRVVSPKATSSIQHHIAIAFRNIKNDFNYREKNSRALVKELELKTLLK